MAGGKSRGAQKNQTGRAFRAWSALGPNRPGHARFARQCYRMWPWPQYAWHCGRAMDAVECEVRCMANTVMHFEIPADDVARAKNFYEKTFGWTIKAFPMPDGQ